MKWILLILLPASIQAQSLKPGIYQDLKPTGPIVLDTGDYTFINLEMKNLGNGIWLDGRKATKIELVNCIFGGKGTGIGLAASSHVKVEKCVFSHLERGIWIYHKTRKKGKNKVKKPEINLLAYITSNTFEKLNTGIDLEAIENNSISIQGNTFRDNVVGVELKANENNTTVPVLGFSLRCNNFEQTTSVPTGQQRIGLLIGEGVSFFDDRIGGNNQNQTGPPNSNYFPRTINSTTQAIEPFPGYYSVWNESANQNSYYNYANEDLGNVYPQQTSGLPNYVDDEPVSDISITRQNLENWCLEVPSTATQPNWQGNGVVLFPLLVDCREMEESELGALKTAQLIPNNWVLACEGGPLDHIAFPIPKPLASSIVSEMVESLTKDKVYLGQSIPNPANHRVTIPVLLAEFKGNMVLEIFDLASGKTMSQKVISSLGQHMVDFDVQTWAAGIYGYRILLPEGKSPAPKKMVLVK